MYTAAGRRRPGPPRRGQRRAPHPLLRRLLGLGLPRGRRRQRPAGLRARSPAPASAPPRPDVSERGSYRPRKLDTDAEPRRWPRERLGRLRGLGPPPALRAGRAQLPLPLLPHLPRPRRAARACSIPSRSTRPAAAPRPASAAPTTWATRPGRWPSAPATRSRPRPARRPAGPVRLLTGLRYLGHCFNPVSFYYCFDAAGRRVEAVVAEVENIPWGERHAYVLARGENAGTGAEPTSSTRRCTSRP